MLVRVSHGVAVSLCGWLPVPRCRFANFSGHVRQTVTAILSSLVLRVIMQLSLPHWLFSSRYLAYCLPGLLRPLSLNGNVEIYILETATLIGRLVKYLVSGRMLQLLGPISRSPAREMKSPVFLYSSRFLCFLPFSQIFSDHAPFL